ncbi:hypothetical protein SAMN05216298_2856 [Glycomyces sambucus]|uniref:Uncharacterized protein n=1 Tax=Glycomyces sambucus TaxID=380244 RepID=A0A1G9HVQ7_9ACTN|nr:hypothetical protein [Glycomyces sambucus]SDL16895.1 hypothetical protein SAMN05216298_2856 [Glycomyces sambucus]
MTEDFAAGVDAIADAVRAVPGVSGLHGGQLGEIAVLLPGRRIPGLRLGDTECEVHVAVDWGADIPLTAAAVRVAVAPLVGGRPVVVTVEDIDFGGTGEDIDVRGTVEDIDVNGTGEGTDSKSPGETAQASDTVPTAARRATVKRTAERPTGAAPSADRTSKGD